jgi:hypothetical protein
LFQQPCQQKKTIVIQAIEQLPQHYDAPSAKQSAQLLLPAPQRFRQGEKNAAWAALNGTSPTQ